MCLTPKQSQSQRMTEYFKLHCIYSPIYEGTILLKYLLQDLSPTSLVFHLHLSSSTLWNVHTHQHPPITHGPRT